MRNEFTTCEWTGVLGSRDQSAQFLFSLEGFVDSRKSSIRVTNSKVDSCTDLTQTR